MHPITQVGLMMIELALGWPRILVLIHFLGNASLRTYQIMVSPSVVVHMLQMQTIRAAAGHRWSSRVLVTSASAARSLCLCA